MKPYKKEAGNLNDYKFHYQSIAGWDPDGLTKKSDSPSHLLQILIDCVYPEQCEYSLEDCELYIANLE